MRLKSLRDLGRETSLRKSADNQERTVLQPAQTASHLHVGIGQLAGRLNGATTLSGLICDHGSGQCEAA